MSFRDDGAASRADRRPAPRGRGLRRGRQRYRSPGDTFYVAYQGGSSTTTLTRLVIDGNQDGNATQLTEPDVYFDIDATNQTGQGTGSGGGSWLSVQ
ncbi:MAG: hypothetical protein R3B96_06690 [Pirellulaceae bacterium]